ncbi:MAG TPA: PH domain-containing protein [Burkholderiales bacterium]|nr:PH domain-containing protein [Burkholderiales bacterium]
MASYVESVLIPGEQVVHRARISKWSLAPLLFFGVLLLPVGIGLVLLVWAWIRYATTELAVTNKRVIAKTGLIQRKTVELFISKVESVQVDQGILGRIFDYGTVTLTGTGVQSAPFKSIADPLRFRKLFMTAADSPAARAT